MADQALGPHQQELIEGLRSGEYKQTQGQLQDSQGCYCVLGAACAIAYPAGDLNTDETTGYLRGGSLAEQPKVLEYFGFRGDEGPPEYHLPQSEYIKLFGYLFDECSVAHGHMITMVDMIELNDTWELTFDQLADILEKFPDLYFVEPR